MARILLAGGFVLAALLALLLLRGDDSSVVSDAGVPGTDAGTPATAVATARRPMVEEPVAAPAAVPIPVSHAAAAEYSGATRPMPEIERDAGTPAAAQSPDVAHVAEAARLVQVVAQMQSAIEELQAALADQQSKVAELEAELADERARRAQEVQATIVRERDLTSMTYGLAEAEQALATGSSDVSRVLARAQAMASDVAVRAGAAGATQEAALAYEAQHWLAVSQDALSRGDLYEARLAVQVAGFSTARARGLASTSVGGTGGY